MRMPWLLLVALSFAQAEVTLYSSRDEDLIDLHLLGLVPVTGKDFNFGGAQIIVYDIAAIDIGRTSILPNYRLNLHIEDSKVSSEVSISVLCSIVNN